MEPAGTMFEIVQMICKSKQIGDHTRHKLIQVKTCDALRFCYQYKIMVRLIHHIQI